MNIEGEVRQFIVDELLLGQRNVSLEADTPLVSSGIIDSLGLVRLINFIEESFTIQIGDDELIPDHFESLANIVDLVRNKRQMPADK